MVEAPGTMRTEVMAGDEPVLTGAVARAADLWQLTNAQLRRIIGISTAQASRLRSGQKQLARGPSHLSWIKILSACTVPSMH